MKKSTLPDIARAAGLTPYDRHAVSSVSNIGAAVESATRGRTHFYEPDTMRYFSCRVQHARILCDGMVIGTVCTQARGFRESDGRCYVVNFHDLTGDTLNRKSEDRPDYNTRAQADRAFAEFAAGLDGARVLADAVRREKASHERALKRLRVAIRSHNRRLSA